MKVNQTNMINRFGEFKDKKLEKEYEESELIVLFKYLRPIVLLLGILYFLFVIPDFFFVKNPKAFQLIFLVRAVYLILIGIFFFRMKSIKKYSTLCFWVTLYEVMASVVFIFVFYQYESPDFFIQAFGIIAIILAVCLVPNRWINMIMVSVFTAVTFFAASIYFLEKMDTSDFSAVIFYILLVAALSSSASFRTHLFKRIHFLNGRDLIQLSIRDPLTGIYNRLKFDDELDKWISYAKRYPCDLSLMIIDIDYFKEINDCFGHLTGDKVLTEVTDLVRGMIRETDIFARWGGEEFVILLPNTHKSEAVEITERIRKRISDYDFTSGRLTCSFGVDSWRKEEERDSFVQRVDTLLLNAKEIGKNNVQSDDAHLKKPTLLTE
ncbi:diguanylate cyclase with GAF sensor [Dehalobacter sp. UNSWDHB]|uniref:GGDEF domain-containing protein n=1 Tax=Dehalobacter sp. UNSWDHB TaxID=1339256 RepID=UPI00038D557B|nr:diguanylate cyclase [Dehalobacter sp. UNSWDHB]EQB20849.1 diguanylate cyclase with GAF sensor [Dehalobacter sp. UNSWDHB]